MRAVRIAACVLALAAFAPAQVPPDAAGPPASEGAAAPADLPAETTATPPPRANERPPRAAVPGPAAAQAGNRASPAAGAFALALREALALELQVLETERATLGQEDPETLEGYRRTRRLRIEQDRDFTSLQSQVSLSAMAAPSAADASALGRDARALLSQIDRAYEGSRDTKIVQQYADANRAFLKTGDWAQRDRAVTQRDALLEREIGYTRLLHHAADLVAGRAGDEVLDDMRATLTTIAPETAGAQDDLARMVFDDAALREDVMADLRSVLTVTPEPPTALREADELTPLVNNLQLTLIQEAGLEPVVSEHLHVTSELEKVDQALETRPDPYLVGRKAELLGRKQVLEQQWYTTRPDPGTFDELIRNQDELIRRLMADLGSPGVLFATRFNGVHAATSGTNADTLSQWRLLDRQRDLLTDLDAARPAVDPLEGLSPPASLILPAPPVAKALPKAKPAPKAAPKPVPKKKPHKAPPKAKPKPKPKAKPHGKKGHGKGHGMAGPF